MWGWAKLFKHRDMCVVVNTVWYYHDFNMIKYWLYIWGAWNRTERITRIKDIWNVKSFIISHILWLTYPFLQLNEVEMMIVENSQLIKFQTFKKVKIVQHITILHRINGACKCQYSILVRKSEEKIKGNWAKLLHCFRCGTQNLPRILTAEWATCYEISKIAYVIATLSLKSFVDCISWIYLKWL